MNEICAINSILQTTTSEGVLSLFDASGYIRFNMLYIYPTSLVQFKEKLRNIGLVDWVLTEKELVFRFQKVVIKFAGSLNVVFKGNKIFCMEMDFDAVCNDGESSSFYLKEIEKFLKYCDAIFFDTYFMSIDTEILNNPLYETINFIAKRK